MKIRDSYDWVVLGEHPGALLSAGLAARLGLSVLIVPFGQTARLSFSSNAQHLDPEPNFLLGLQGGESGEPLTRICLDRIGMTEEESASIEGGEGLFQVVSGNGRFGFGSPKFFSGELKREIGHRWEQEFPLLSVWEQSHRDILRGWSAFPKSLTLAMDKKDPRRPGPRDKGFPLRGTEAGTARAASFHSALHYGVTGQNRHDPSPARMIEALAVGTTGARFKGGLTAYRELLTNLARRLGADIAAKTDCRKIQTDGNRVTGVQLAGRSGTIRAGGIAVGARLSDALARIQGMSKRTSKAGSSGLTPTAWRYTLALTVADEAIPPGVAYRVIWTESDAPPLEIEFSRIQEYGGSGVSDRIVFLRTLLPYASETLVPGYQRLISARMMRKFSDLFPFAEFHVVRVFPEFREQERKRGSLNLKIGKTMSLVSGEGEGASPFMVSDLKEIPDNLLVYGEVGLGTGTKLEGMFLVGDESYPALGSLGGTVAALEGVSWMAHRAGLSGPFV